MVDAQPVHIYSIVITLTVVSNWLIDCIILYRWGQWPQKYKCTQVNDPKVQAIQNIHWFSVNLPLKNVHGCFLVLCCDVSSDNFGCENAGSRPRLCTYRQIVIRKECPSPSFSNKKMRKTQFQSPWTSRTNSCNENHCGLG